MAVTKELVLYYQPEVEKQTGNDSKAAKLKTVLIRMGIRIRNISSDQMNQTVGYLAGIEGFDETAFEEILVMKNFSNRRVDELLLNLRRAGVPKVQLKAVVTDTNCKWRFYDLYEELKEENEAMSKIPKS
jgi:hypothetical protein